MHNPKDSELQTSIGGLPFEKLEEALGTTALYDKLLEIEAIAVRKNGSRRHPNVRGNEYASPCKGSRLLHAEFLDRARHG